jgi:hypothetical protein
MSLSLPALAHPLRGYALAAAACGLAVLVAKPLTAWLDQANIVMLFLLVVFLLALRLGKGRPCWRPSCASPCSISSLCRPTCPSPWRMPNTW